MSSKIVDHTQSYEEKMPGVKMPDTDRFFDYEVFKESYWIDSAIKGFPSNEHRDRYNYSFTLSLPVPRNKNNSFERELLKKKVGDYIDTLKNKWIIKKRDEYDSSENYSPEENLKYSDRDIINPFIKTLLTKIQEAYVARLLKDLREWLQYLAVKRRIDEYKAKNADKLPGSEYWNSIYAGGSNFCPLNSFVPGSPPAGFIYAGDKRFHQFILKQGE